MTRNPVLIVEGQEMVADEILRNFRQGYITPRWKESRYRLATVSGTAPAAIIPTNPISLLAERESVSAKKTDEVNCLLTLSNLAPPAAPTSNFIYGSRCA